MIHSSFSLYNHFKTYLFFHIAHLIKIARNNLLKRKGKKTNLKKGYGKTNDSLCSVLFKPLTLS